MRTKRRELLSLVLIGMCSFGAIQAGAQVEGADGDSTGAFTRRDADAVDRLQSVGRVAGRLIKLDIHQVTMKDALRAVARHAEVPLIYNDSDLPTDRLVTVTISDATVEEALVLVLRGTELRAHRSEGGIVIERRANRERSERRVRQGSITGRVTDAATGRPIQAVKIGMEESALTATTGDDGSYRFLTVPAGTYTLTARRVGYERIARTVVVEDDQETSADLAMTPAPTMLDQVVTTGTLIPTEVKALPTPVSVITADQIEQQHGRTIMAIIRQAVPTAVAHDAPNAPANSDISVRGASSLTGPGTMKIFVDGVETTSFGNTPVDPASIDRIEIVRGPQAATLYGADAAGGVIQIFTKRGDPSLTNPQADLRIAAGVAQTPYKDVGKVGRQRYNGSIQGGASNVSYRFGGGYTRLADYVPANSRSRQSSASVYRGMNFSRGILAADLSARYYRNTIPQAYNPDLFATGYVPFSRPFYTRGELTNETYGARITVSPIHWWRNQLTLGIDRLGLRNTQTQARLTTPADTLLHLQNSTSRKLSIGYSTTAIRTTGRDFSSSLTLGLDHYVQAVNSYSTTQALNTDGTIVTSPAGRLNVADNSVTNTGYFAQIQVGVHDALFLTLGVRAEDNSTFGEDYGMATLPRVGLSFTRSIGAATLKLRASYGKALRTPGPTKAAGGLNASSIKLANPNLAPERQQGWDGGADLVFGNHGSLSIGGFDQTARDLIAFLQVSSSPLPTYQYQNIGRVSNRGVEIEGTLRLTRWLSTRAQYGYVHSRIKAVGAAGGQVEVGDEPVGVPAHTAGAALTMMPSDGTTFTGGVTYVGSFRNTDVQGELRCLAALAAPPCPESFLSTFSTRDFIVSYPGFAKINLGVTHRFTRQLEAFLYIDNLANEEAFEFDNSSPVIGRTTTLGVEVTF